VTVDLDLLDHLDRAQPGKARESPQTLGGEAPVDEVVAGVDVARPVDLDRGRVLVERGPVGLEDDLAVGLEHGGQRAEDRDRVAHAMQHAEAEHHVEALVELADVERVEHPVVDLRGEQLMDRVEPGRRRELESEATADPVDVLLVVDRDDPAGAARLGQERVEAVEAADVQDAAPLEAVGAEDLGPVAMVASETGGVDAGREVERVKPEGDGVAGALG
jgi:hypothetical protein